MRLRSELLRSLGKAPIDTVRSLRDYARADQEAAQKLSALGLDEALTHFDRGSSRVAQTTSLSLTFIMRVGESFRRGRRTCLDRALARYAFLSAAGSTPSFVIGLDRNLDAHHEAEALGHAWVEVQGEPCPNEDITAYRVSYRHAAERSPTPRHRP